MRQDERVANWVVVMRFAVDSDAADAFTAEARDVARLLAGFDGCEGVEVGRASDDPTLWVMVARWQSVGSYRRALSSYEVKLNAVPFLSKAIDEPTAFEVLYALDEDGERTASGDLAGDAGTVERSR
ncbi:MAG: antibiotic biosynthesis monooxygenase [Actinomycetia bacterium]|nr:antibiotic biosynthesis monooxygenase [Actinomycetes bacterium]